MTKKSKWIIFVTCVSFSSLPFWVVCFLQPCGHLLALADLLALLYVTLFCQFPIRFSGSGVVLVSIPDLRILPFISIKNASKNAK